MVGGNVRNIVTVPMDGGGRRLETTAVYIPKPGFTIQDLHAVWEPDMLGVLALEPTVTNIGDRRYVAHSTLTQNGPAIQAAGRDVRLALRYRC